MLHIKKKFFAPIVFFLPEYDPELWTYQFLYNTSRIFLKKTVKNDVSIQVLSIFILS